KADNPKLGRAGGAQRRKPCTSRGTASWKTPLLSAVVVASCVPLRSVKRQTALAIGECGRPSSTLPCKVAVVAETEGGGTFPPPLTPPLPLSLPPPQPKMTSKLRRPHKKIDNARYRTIIFF